MIDPMTTGRAWRDAGEVGPPVDIYETAAAVVVRVAVPGVEGTSLSLVVDDERLTVHGESLPPGAAWDDRTVVHWQEIPHGRFDRAIPLPANVDRNGVKASFKNGVLEIVLRKRSVDAPRTVTVKVT
jgi:HSP20 family protein